MAAILLNRHSHRFDSSFLRLSLQFVDRWRDLRISWTHETARHWPWIGLLLKIALVSAAALAASLVRRLSPYAGGSGIPHIEAVANCELPPVPLSLVPVKFFGGLLAIGGGLALGREGPSVQMGADIGAFVGKKLHLPESHCVALLAACGGAGIATAFNAPIAAPFLSLRN